jgi:hypothetical protein
MKILSVIPFVGIGSVHNYKSTVTVTYSQLVGLESVWLFFWGYFLFLFLFLFLLNFEF